MLTSGRVFASSLAGAVSARLRPGAMSATPSVSRSRLITPAGADRGLDESPLAAHICPLLGAGDRLVALFSSWTVLEFARWSSSTRRTEGDLAKKLPVPERAENGEVITFHHPRLLKGVGSPGVTIWSSLGRRRLVVSKGVLMSSSS